MMKPANNKIKVDYKIEDVEKMTLKSDLFDCVVDTFGLNYTLYPEKCLNEMKRVCKPNGKILLIESGKSNHQLLNYYLEIMLPLHIDKYGYFNNRDWEAIIGKSGLKIIEHEERLNGSIQIFVLENI